MPQTWRCSNVSSLAQAPHKQYAPVIGTPEGEAASVRPLPDLALDALRPIDELEVAEPQGTLPPVPVGCESARPSIRRSDAAHEPRDRRLLPDLGKVTVVPGEGFRMLGLIRLP